MFRVILVFSRLVPQHSGLSHGGTKEILITTFLVQKHQNRNQEEEEKIMAPKSKTAQKRTKAKEIPKSKKQMTGKDMRKVKGGLATPVGKASKDVSSLNYTKIEF